LIIEEIKYIVNYNWGHDMMFKAAVILLVGHVLLNHVIAVTK